MNISKILLSTLFMFPFTVPSSSSAVTYQTVPITPEVQNKIFQGLQEYALQATGIAGDHLDEKPISFEAWEGETLAGALVVKRFWGQMHIRLLFAHPQYRAQGIARRLMEQAFAYAKSLGCNFIFVETLSFQAVGFYKKMGFQVEFTRPGYLNDIQFHYLKKDLESPSK